MKAIYAIIVAILATAIGLAFKILPTSPFLAYLGLSDLSGYLPYINYFVPIDAFIVISEEWLLAMSAWFLWKFGKKAVSVITDLKPL